MPVQVMLWYSGKGSIATTKLLVDSTYTYTTADSCKLTPCYNLLNAKAHLKYIKKKKALQVEIYEANETNVKLPPSSA